MADGSSSMWFMTCCWHCVVFCQFIDWHWGKTYLLCVWLL